MVGDLNKAITIGNPAGGSVTYSSIFTGTFGDVISYISGSNPSINATDGTENLWNAHSGDVSSAGTLLNTGMGVGRQDVTPQNPAPIKLPVPLTSLNTSDC